MKFLTEQIFFVPNVVSANLLELPITDPNIKEITLIGTIDPLIIDELKSQNLTIWQMESDFTNEEEFEDRYEERTLIHKTKYIPKQLEFLDEHEALFKSGEVTYYLKGINTLTLNRYRLVLRTKRAETYHTDRVDLISFRARKNYANDVCDVLGLPVNKVEKDLLKILTLLDEWLSDQLKEKEIKPLELTESDIQNAKKFLTQSDLLNQIIDDLEAMGYLGEENNKLLLYLIATSRKLQAPLSAMIRSNSASGKTFITDILSELIGEESIHLSRLSSNALYYMPKTALMNKLIIIDEAKGKNDQIEYAIRSLQSRGRLTLSTVQRDISGRQRTKHIEILGPVSFMDTATNNSSNPENTNRCFVIGLDESQEQTKRVFDAQIRKRQMVSVDKRSVIQKHQHAQHILRPLKVIIPFAHLIEFPCHYLESRRRFDQLLSLIEACAFLHQYQRKIIQTLEGEAVVAEIIDYSVAYHLIIDSLKIAFSDLDEFTTSIWNQIKSFVRQEAKAQGIEIDDFEFTRKDIRTWTFKPDYLLKKLLPQLENLEYLNKRIAGRGGMIVYRLGNETNNKIVEQLTSPETLKDLFGSDLVNTK